MTNKPYDPSIGDKVQLHGIDRPAFSMTVVDKFALSAEKAADLRAIYPSVRAGDTAYLVQDKSGQRINCLAEDFVPKFD